MCGLVLTISQAHRIKHLRRGLVLQLLGLLLGPLVLRRPAGNRRQLDRVLGVAHRLGVLLHCYHLVSAELPPGKHPAFA